MVPQEKRKEQLIVMLNKGLELEHAARIQYLSHAELISGQNAEPIIARIKEIAEDEAKHEESFREMIGGYLGGVPTMGMAETHAASSLEDILETNIDIERRSVLFYEEILGKIKEMRQELKYEYFQLEHGMRHIIQDEEEHISELRLLLGQ
jgi:bacterioferritin (cytochrome b1)